MGEEESDGESGGEEAAAGRGGGERGRGLRTAPRPPSRAVRAEVTALPQPMAAANPRQAARPPRFKSASVGLSELHVGRPGRGGRPGAGPVGSRGSPGGGQEPVPPAPWLPARHRRERKAPGAAPLGPWIPSRTPTGNQRGGEVPARGPRSGCKRGFGRGDLALIGQLSGGRLSPWPPEYPRRLSSAPSEPLGR